MDLNLYLGLPRVPRPRRSDLGSDLSLGTPMPSSPSSSAASVDAPPQPEPLLPPYSPSRADLSPAPPEAYFPYNPEDPPAPDAHLPYMPPPERLISGLHDDIQFAAFQHPPPLVRASELLDWDSLEDRPSSSTASSSIFPDTAAWYRLLEQTGSQRPRTRRFRSDLPPLSSEARPIGQDVVVPMPQHEPASNTAANKVTAVIAALGASEESTDDQSKTAATFECNICFDMASEPVVTSCGHLFCWPCLYQWLNVYSNHKECPVCKGEVTEANITPIYGRGNSDGEKAVEDVKPPAGPAIPPRPHGNRIESFRQQFHYIRPISRRLGEAHGMLYSWRRLLDQQIMNSDSRIEGPSEAGQEVSDNVQHTVRLGRLGTLASWMRARRLQRETESATGGANVPDSGLPGSGTSESSRHGSTPLDLLEHLAMIGVANTERLTAVMNDLRRIASPSQFGGSTSSSNSQNNEPTVVPTHVAGGPSADQASNSSTVAMIQGDAGISESAGEPSNAGSSRYLRRRRSNTLGSLDVDGGGLQQNKRRRMN